MFDDFERSPVPADKTVRGWHIGLIYIGVGLTLPAFLTGSVIGSDLGFWGGIWATVIAGLILTAVAILTGWIGASVKLSTYHIAQLAFGRWGGHLVNLLLTLTLFGWFGVTVDLFAEAVHHACPWGGVDKEVWGAVGGVLMVSTAVWGFRGLDKFSLIAVPLITFALLWTDWQAIDLKGWSEVLRSGTGAIPFGVAVSMLVGGWIVGAVVLPDLSRYARKPLDGSLGAVLSFLPGLLVVVVMSMIPTLAMGEKDIVKIMLELGVPVVTILTIVLATWSTNDNNLYSAALGISTLIPNVPKWKITLTAGLIGTCLGVAGMMNHFVTFLVFLGILIPPVAGVYIADFFVRENFYCFENVGKSGNFNFLNLFAWAIGCAIALMTVPTDSRGLGWFTLTGIPALDGVLGGFVVVWIASIIRRKRSKQT